MGMIFAGQWCGVRTDARQLSLRLAANTRPNSGDHPTRTARLAAGDVRAFERMSEPSDTRAGLTEAEMRENFLTLVFQADPVRYETFCAVLAEALPADVAAVIRGS